MVVVNISERLLSMLRKEKMGRERETDCQGTYESMRRTIEGGKEIKAKGE